MAIENNYPADQLYKLYLRAAQCHLKLDQKDLVEEALSKVTECIKNNNILPSSKRGIGIFKMHFFKLNLY